MTRSDLARHLTLQDFTELDIAAAFVLFRTKHEGAAVTSLSEVCEFFESEGISHPNRSRLKQRMLADRRLLATKAGFKVRLAATAEIDATLEGAAPTQPIHATTPLVETLNNHACLITNPHTQSFLLEAIECVRGRTYRAAVIMAWCGAVAVLQEYVFTHCLEDFNRDAMANGLVKREIKTLSDMRGISKESQFVECLGRISLFDDSMKRTLKRCLDRRNDFGHPSDATLGEAAVADHIESLILNVFSRFNVGSAKAA